jgi:hypothetical protein
MFLGNARLACEDAEYARGRAGGPLIDANDLGVGVRRSHHIGESHVRQSKVVDEIALAGDEATILDATRRRTYPRACDFLPTFHGVVSSCSSLGRAP